MGINDDFYELIQSVRLSLIQYFADDIYIYLYW